MPIPQYVKYLKSDDIIDVEKHYNTFKKKYKFYDFCFDISAILIELQLRKLNSFVFYITQLHLDYF